MAPSIRLANSCPTHDECGKQSLGDSHQSHRCQPDCLLWGRDRYYLGCPQAIQPSSYFLRKRAAADGARPRPGSVIHHIEFSSSRRGQLATMEKDSSYVRFWDLLHAQGTDGASDGDRSRDSSHSRVPRRSWTNLAWAAAPGVKQTSSELQEASVLVLADTRRSKPYDISSHLPDGSLIHVDSKPFYSTSRIIYSRASFASVLINVRNHSGQQGRRSGAPCSTRHAEAAGLERTRGSRDRRSSWTIVQTYSRIPG